MEQIQTALDALAQFRKLLIDPLLAVEQVLQDAHEAEYSTSKARREATNLEKKVEDLVAECALQEDRLTALATQYGEERDRLEATHAAREAALESEHQRLLAQREAEHEAARDAQQVLLEGLQAAEEGLNRRVATAKSEADEIEQTLERLRARIAG